MPPQAVFPAPAIQSAKNGLYSNTLTSYLQFPYRQGRPQIRRSVRRKTARQPASFHVSPPFPTCRPVKAAPCPTFVPGQIGTLESATHNPTSPHPEYAGKGVPPRIHRMAWFPCATAPKRIFGREPTRQPATLAAAYRWHGLLPRIFPPLRPIGTDYSSPVFRKSSPRPPAVAATCRRHGFLPRNFPSLQPIGTDDFDPGLRKSSPRPSVVCDLLFTFALH